MFEIRRLAAIENGKSRAYTLQRTAVALPERFWSMPLNECMPSGSPCTQSPRSRKAPQKTLSTACSLRAFGAMPHYVLTPDGELHDAGMHCISVAAVEE